MAEKNQGAKAAGGRGLGRGLSALLGESEPEAPPVADSAARQRNLPIAFLKPNRHQPRRAFNDDELKDLASSIREKGVLQPILLRPLGAESYEIVAGERRWRAAQMAKLHEVPVVIRTVSDAESLELAIVENVQRADLNAIEEGAAYQELIHQFQYTQEKLSEVIGKSRSHVANTIRLLKLPEGVQALIIEGKLSAGHARTLIGTPNPEALAKEILAGSLNVRQAEKKARIPKGKGTKRSKDADTKALEASVSSALGLDVKIEHEGDKGGEVRIRYKTLEQLDEIIRRLNAFVEVD
jgi:ParB family transcriptional regulator, chromosome partitioning protein